MSKGGAALCRNRQFLARDEGKIRPEKECIKSCETCFAKNALRFNVKGTNTK